MQRTQQGDWRLDVCREDARRHVSVPDDVKQLLVELRTYLQEKCEPPVYVSDRRLLKSVNLMKVGKGPHTARSYPRQHTLSAHSLLVFELEFFFRVAISEPVYAARCVSCISTQARVLLDGATVLAGGGVHERKELCQPL